MELLLSREHTKNNVAQHYCCSCVIGWPHSDDVMSKCPSCDWSLIGHVTKTNTTCECENVVVFLSQFTWWFPRNGREYCCIVCDLCTESCCENWNRSYCWNPLSNIASFERFTNDSSLLGVSCYVFGLPIVYITWRRVWPFVDRSAVVLECNSDCMLLAVAMVLVWNCP